MEPSVREADLQDVQLLLVERERNKSDSSGESEGGGVRGDGAPFASPRGGQWEALVPLVCSAGRAALRSQGLYTPLTRIVRDIGFS